MRRAVALIVAIMFLGAFTSALYAATAGGSVPAADKKFVQKAAVDGMYEVQAGKVAAEKATSPDVKKFGQRMVDDHTKANTELTQIAKDKGINVPTGLDKKGESELGKLSKASGADFDKQYMSRMVKDHKTDVAAFKKEADNGKDPEIKAFAAKTLPTLQEHLKMAQDMLASTKK